MDVCKAVEQTLSYKKTTTYQQLCRDNLSQTPEDVQTQIVCVFQKTLMSLRSKSWFAQSIAAIISVAVLP
jgi:hypothetical protein